jgi:hypothetical protein
MRVPTTGVAAPPLQSRNSLKTLKLLSLVCLSCAQIPETQAKGSAPVTQKAQGLGRMLPKEDSARPWQSLLLQKTVGVKGVGFT